MMRYPLKSSFAEQIRSFVDYKNSLGFPYDESCRMVALKGRCLLIRLRHL